MGEDMVNRIEKELQWPNRQPATASLSIHGSTDGTDWNDPFYFYGSDAPLLRQSMNGTAGKWLSEALKIHPMQVRWAVKHEMARTVEDVLSRRTRALLLDARESIRIAPEVAKLMAEALGKDEIWIAEQVAAYTALAEHYVLSDQKVNKGDAVLVP